MPRFSLPKISRSSPLILFLIFIFIILVAGGGYYYFRVIRKPKLPPHELQLEAEEKAKRGKEEYEKLKQEVRVQQEEMEARPALIEECLEVYLDNPKNGIYRMDKVDEKIFDYFYKGRVAKVEEKTEGGCVYINLSLEGPQSFTLVLPSGMKAETDLGDIYPTIYNDHINSLVDLKIRFQDIPINPNLYKIIEWVPLVFSAD